MKYVALNVEYYAPNTKTIEVFIGEKKIAVLHRESNQWYLELDPPKSVMVGIKRQDALKNTLIQLGYFLKN